MYWKFPNKTSTLGSKYKNCVNIAQKSCVWPESLLLYSSHQRKFASSGRLCIGAFSEHYSISLTFLNLSKKKNLRIIPPALNASSSEYCTPKIVLNLEQNFMLFLKVFFTTICTWLVFVVQSKIGTRPLQWEIWMLTTTPKWSLFWKWFVFY